MKILVLLISLLTSFSVFAQSQTNGSCAVTGKKEALFYGYVKNLKNQVDYQTYQIRLDPSREYVENKNCKLSKFYAEKAVIRVISDYPRNENDPISGVMVYDPATNEAEIW